MTPPTSPYRGVISGEAPALELTQRLGLISYLRDLQS